MPDESEVPVPLAEKAKRKPGRPRKRHDPDAAPVDGDYQNDQIVNKRPGYDYGLVSDRLMGRYLAQGWEVEGYGADCARPRWDYGKHKDGDPVRINNQLTLVRIPAKRRQAISQRERQWHNDAKASLKHTAESTGGKHTVFKGVHF